MGEYAGMMLDGTLCECCGTYIDDDGGDGIPRYCSNQCARDRGALHALPRAAVVTGNPAKTNCVHCGKRVKIAGLEDHIRFAHPITADLLAALEGLLVGVYGDGYVLPAGASATARARAAIAKARGTA